jgi:hypothetical protein
VEFIGVSGRLLINKTMKFLVKCTLPDVRGGKRCGHIFTAHDELIADHDYNCPRCGKRPAKIIFTADQIRKHVPYRHIANGRVVRVGLENKMVVADGYYMVDEKTNSPIRYDLGVPRFG